MSTVLIDLSVLHTDVRLYGIGRYARDLITGLNELGNSRLRIVGVGWLPLRGPAEPADLEPPRFEGPASWAWRVRLRLASAARRAGAELVHSPHAGATPIGLDCPRVVTCHDLIPLRYPKHYLSARRGGRLGRWAVEWRRYRSARHVIAISRSTADDAMRLLGVPAARISLVHSGVDLAQWSPVHASTDVAALARLGLAGRRFALYVGGDDWRKNMVGMLQALAELHRRHRDVLLVWAGRAAPRRLPLIRKLASDLGVATVFLSLGHVEDRDLAVLYRHAVCLLFISRCEGFGYPLVESMASGCPVVSSGASSLGEVGGDATLNVDAESPAAVAAAVGGLVDNEHERNRLAAAGLARAQAFSLRHMAEGTREVYSQVLGRH